MRCDISRCNIVAHARIATYKSKLQLCSQGIVLGATDGDRAAVIVRSHAGYFTAYAREFTKTVSLSELLARCLKLSTD